MRKLVIICLFVLNFLISSSFAQTLTGGVSYTVDEIRKIAFQDVSSKIDINEYKKYFVFEKNTEKKLGLLNIFAPYRITTRFSNGSYAVRYKKDSERAYYYDSSGHLKKIDFMTKDKTKQVSYDNKGNLDSVVLALPGNEQYMFDNKGKLSAHWIGNNCYNEKGELVMTRK